MEPPPFPRCPIVDVVWKWFGTSGFPGNVAGRGLAFFFPYSHCPEGMRFFEEHQVKDDMATEAVDEVITITIDIMMVIIMLTTEKLCTLGWQLLLEW